MIKQTKPIELYYWATPNGRKVSIMLEELGVPYNVHLINIGRGDQYKPEFTEISPNNRIPAIVDPEGPGGAPISIFESGAILKYLAEKFEKFYPADWRQRINVDEWLFWQMGGFGPTLGQNHHFGTYAKEKIEYAISRFQNETDRLYAVLEKQLSDKDYICGDISIADIASIGWANRYQRHKIDLDEFPNVKAWRERMNARPAVKKGMALGETQGESVDFAKDEIAQKILFKRR